MSGEDWSFNYYNYFTEAEEHFQRARGSALFRFSTLDWALLEGWKNSGVPLEAVLRGIDAAFARWRSRKSRVQQINSLAYCAQAVLTEAQILAGAAPPKAAAREAPPFPVEDLRAFLTRNAEALRAQGGAFEQIAASLDRLAADAGTHFEDLEQLEQRLTALEEIMIAAARAAQSEERLFEARRALASELRPYRSKMTAAQLAMLERQYLDRRLLEDAGLPRLSLFYLR